MNAKQKDATSKAVMTGLMLAGAAVASMATIGCDQLSETQLQVMPLESSDEINLQSGVANIMELNSKISLNHNETFLTGMNA